MCRGIFKAILPDQLCHAKNTKLFLFMTLVKKKKKRKTKTHEILASKTLEIRQQKTASPER